MLIHLIVLLFNFSAQATLFKPQTVDQQIKEADGVMVGHFLRSHSVRLENGSIATQMVFKVNKEVGLQSDLFGVSEIIIHYPGGQIGAEATMISGVPKFIPGEKVVVMVKNIKNRFWGMNLGLGSFKVINYGKEKLLVNNIFPDDLRVGQISMEDFEKKIRVLKRMRLRVVYDEYSGESNHQESNIRVPASVEKVGKKRALASDREEKDNGVGVKHESSSLGIFWLLIIFAGFGGLFRLLKQRKAH